MPFMKKEMLDTFEFSVEWYVRQKIIDKAESDSDTDLLHLVENDEKEIENLKRFASQ